MRQPSLYCTAASVAAAIALLAATSVAAETVKVHLKGFEEVPSVSTAASGELRLKIDDHAGTIDYELSYENLQGAVTQAHIHVGQAGVNGGISIWLCQGTVLAPPAVAAQTPHCPSAGTVTGTITASSVIGPAGQLVAAGELEEVIRAIRAGVAYGNVHSSVTPGGEIRGQLH